MITLLRLLLIINVGHTLSVMAMDPPLKRKEVSQQNETDNAIFSFLKKMQSMETEGYVDATNTIYESSKKGAKSAYKFLFALLPYMEGATNLKGLIDNFVAMAKNEEFAIKAPVRSFILQRLDQESKQDVRQGSKISELEPIPLLNHFVSRKVVAQPPCRSDKSKKDSSALKMGGDKEKPAPKDMTSMFKKPAVKEVVETPPPKEVIVQPPNQEEQFAVIMKILIEHAFTILDKAHNEYLAKKKVCIIQ